MGKNIPPILPPPAAQDEGSTVIQAPVAYDFRGTGVTVTDAGAGVARVTINSGAGTGDLLAINNLNDVANAATSLSNLGGAPLASPTFTGVPAAPTAAADTNTTQIATTAFVQQELSQSAYIDGEVEFYANLPHAISPTTPPIDSAYLVRESSGVWLINRKPAGIYVRLYATDALTDWVYAGEFTDIFNDANFAVYDNADPTKQVQLQVSGVTTGTVRTLTVPDASGTIALTGAAPTSHAASHVTGGGDIIQSADTTHVGLAPAVTAPAAAQLNVLAVANGETVRTDKALFDSINPADLGPAAPGTQVIAARRDHVHAMPALDDITDVSATSPVSGDSLVWNGTAWVAQQAVPAVGGASVLYLDASAAVADNQSLATSPSSYPQEADTASIDTDVNSGITFLERFVSGALNRTEIPAGNWTFNNYAGITLDTGTNSIVTRINKRVLQTGMTGTFTGAGATRTFTVTGGAPFVAGDANASILLASLIETPTQTAWISAFTSTSVVTVTLTDPAFVNVAGVPLTAIYYLLFSNTSADVNGVGPTLYSNVSAQGAFTGINVTDRLVAAYFGQTTSNVARNISLYHGGTTAYSNIVTPLTTRHNDLAGLNEGDYRHLTATEFTNKVSAAAVIADNALVLGDGGSRGVKASTLTADFVKSTSGVPAAVAIDGTAAEVVVGRSTASSGAPELLATTGTRGTAVVLATSPVLVTPTLGTPSSGTLTNCNGTAKNLIAGNTPVSAYFNFGLF
jgi:hypothetical protein